MNRYAFLLVTIGIALVGCGPGAEGERSAPRQGSGKAALVAPPAKAKPAPAIVRVGYIPIAECAPLYVGLAKGFFAQEGIEVRLQPMKGGASILPAVQTGDLDVGFSNVVSLIALNVGRMPGAPTWLVSLVGASYEKPGARNHALLTRRGETVTPQDVASGRAAIALNTMRNIEELMLRRYLKKRGFPDARPRIVTLGFPEMVSALARKEVDVISVVEPFIEPSLRAGRTALLEHQYLAVADSTLVATYVAADGWLLRNTDTAARFAKAMDAAAADIAGHEAEMRQILESYTRISREDLAVVGMPAFSDRVTPGDLRDTGERMREFGFVSDLPPLEAMIWARPRSK